MAAVIGIAEPAEAPPRAGLGGRAAYAILAVGLEKVVALGIALYLPRHLGLADYGRYALLISYLGFFQALPDLGLEAVLVTRLARAHDDAATLAGRGAMVRLTVSLIGGLVGLGLLAGVTRDATLVGAGALWSLGLLATAGTPYRTLLRARLRMGSYLGLLAGQAALAVTLLAAVVRADGGLVAVLGAVSAAAIAGVAVGRILVGPGARLRVDSELARALIAETWPLTGTALALVGAQQVLQLLLLRVHGAAEVGLLGGAQKLVEAVGLLPQALMLSVLPALSLAAATPGAAARTARDASRLLLVVLVPAASILIVWAEPLLTLALGPAFTAAAPVLRVLAPAALLGASGMVLTNLLLAVGLQHALLRVTLVSSVATIVLGSVLVPAASAVGAAASVVSGMLVGQTVLFAISTTRHHVAPVLAGMIRPLALGVLTTAAVLALHAPLGLGVAVLLIAYPLALLATGTVTRADLVRWRE